MLSIGILRIMSLFVMSVLAVKNLYICCFSALVAEKEQSNRSRTAV